MNQPFLFISVPPDLEDHASRLPRQSDSTVLLYSFSHAFAPSLAFPFSASKWGQEREVIHVGRV